MASTQSTVTLQNIVDRIETMGDIHGVLDTAGAPEPMLSIANDVYNEICAQIIPWKWNTILCPAFYTNSWQQDYAIPGLTNLAWLMRGTAVDINNASTPKPCKDVEVNREQGLSTAAVCTNSILSNPVFLANWDVNSQLYYGTWGAANTGNASLGNNPVSGSIYTNPIGSQLSQPANPITQIQDANGNLLVLTGYGHEGTTAPVAPANSIAGVVATPGTGATTTWTVVDPNGQGFRLFPVPSQTGIVWQINLVGQAKPIRFTSLSQFLTPLTDDFEPTFRQGCVLQACRYSSEKKVQEKFAKEWPLWVKSLGLMRSKTEREKDANRVVPYRTIQGRRRGWMGPVDPMNYSLIR